MPNLVPLTHPDSTKRLKVPADMVPMYASQGWSEPPKSSADRASGKSGTAPRTTTKKEEA